MTAAIALTFTNTDLWDTYAEYAAIVSSSFEDALLRAKSLLRAGRVSKKITPTRVDVFVNGLPRRVANCPRCGQLLQQEPSSMYCKYGCTRRFMLEGAPISNQFEWERHSGLVGPGGGNDGKLGDWLTRDV